MNLESNIRKVYIITFIERCVFILPVYIIFLKSMGFSLSQAFLLQTIYAIALTVSEFPSGIFADTYGKKKAIVLHFLLWNTGISFYLFGRSYFEFVIAEVFLGIGFALFSGTLTALIYETLKVSGKEADAKKIFGNVQLIGIASSVLANLTGSIMSGISFKLPFLFTLIFFSFGTVLSLTLVEPKIRHKKEHVSPFHVLIESFRVISSRPLLSFLIVYATIGYFILISSWLWQPYMKSLQIPIEIFGIIYGLGNIITAISAKYAYKIECRIGENKILPLTGGLLWLSLLVQGLFVSITSFIIGAILQQFSRGVLMTLLPVYLNRMTPSEERATVNSIVPLLARLLYASSAPIFGYIADVSSVFFVFVIAGLLMMLVDFYLIWAFLLKKIVKA